MTRPRRLASIGLLKKMGNYPLQGTVASHAVGRYLVMVSGVDPHGLSAVDEFTLTVIE